MLKKLHVIKLKNFIYSFIIIENLIVTRCFRTRSNLFI